MADGLVKITDLTVSLCVSSRSLRYYEQAGLLRSVRRGFDKYRYYDAANIERLKQILVLRKMQIPVKDILRIYENENMSVVVEAFVARIRAIDEEIGALSELRRIVGDFLQTMLDNGIKRISAIPLLYEEMERKLDELEGRRPAAASDLDAVGEKLSKPPEIGIISLPPMRAVSSFLKSDPGVTDAEGFYRFVQAAGIAPGDRGRFEFQTVSGEAVIQRMPDGFANDGEYADYAFPGGLFAVANVYLDEDLGERFRSIVGSFDGNGYYQIDYGSDGRLRHPAMLENLISPDGMRELVSLYVPVKKRAADPSLYGKPVEIAPDEITLEELEAQNETLWSAEAPLDTLKPINNPHYGMADDGSAEFIGWVIRGALVTDIPVKFPFRVDITFRMSGDGLNGLVCYHGEDIGYGAGAELGDRGFGVNMGNNPNRTPQAISFHQPVFWDFHTFPGRGALKISGTNRLTWIIGKTHLACVINGEIRYCGTNFPYMSLDLSREPARPIAIGSTGGNDAMYFGSIRVSQLAETHKNKPNKGELTMVTRQSNNIIPIIHRLVTDEYGENYWFNGCAKYAMECLGEPDYDYWLFAGLTGDVFAQHYTKTNYSGESLSSYMMEENMGGDPAGYIEDIFMKCGYAATYVSNKDLRKNTEMYLNTLTAYIDRGVPVIAWGSNVGVYAGYEDYGKVLLLITGNSDQTERVPLSKALQGWTNGEWPLQSDGGWIFVGEKKEVKPLAKIYREAVIDIPRIMGAKPDSYFLGPDAFRAWAGDIENGRFDGMAPADFKAWQHHTNYVCVLATNGSCCHGFLEKARQLNPDFGFLEEVSALYRRTAEMWGGDNSRNDGDSLEALGGGFNVTLETLQDKEKRGRIAAKIRECGDVADKVLSAFNMGISKLV